MAVLSAEETQVFGQSLATAFRPRLERVAVPHVPIERIEEVVESERRPGTRRVTVDVGPQRWTYAVLVGGFALAVAVGLATDSVLAWLVLNVASVVAFRQALRLRRVEEREDSFEETVHVTRKRKVLVPVPHQWQERHVPSTARVRVLGRIDLDFLAIPLGSGTVLVDAQSCFPAQSVGGRLPSDMVAVEAELDRLRAATSQVPAVLSGEGASFPLHEATSFGASVRLTGAERAMWEGFDRLERRLCEVMAESFDLPVVPTQHPLTRFLTPRTTPPPVMPDAATAARRLLDALACARRLERALAAAAADLPARHAVFAGARLVALRRKVGPMCHNLGQQFHYSAFHFYCPECNAEIQKDLLARDYSVRSGAPCAMVTYSAATRLCYDPAGPAWVCPHCEGRFAMDAVIPIHRMLDEVFLPVYDRLMEENKTERLRIYADSRNRELEYRNQMERDMDTLVHGARNSLDQAADEIRRLEAEIEGESEALAAFSLIMASHDQVEKGTLADIERSAREIEARIDHGAEQKRRDLAAFFDLEREVVGATLDALSRSKRLEDERRDAIQRQVAANAQQIAETARRTEAHTARIADASERTAATSERIANRSDQVALDQAELLEQQKRANAIHAATAKAHGVTAGPNALDIVGRIQHGLSDLTSDVLGESDVQRARRHQEL
jgi:hypothetical protein